MRGEGGGPAGGGARPLAHGGPAVALASFVLMGLTTAPLPAQSVRLAGGVGPVLAVGAFEEGVNLARVPVNESRSLRMEWGWPTDLSSPRPAAAGLGLLVIEFPDTDELGHPVTAYGFTHLPLFQLRDVSVRFDAALGVSVGWREFDPLENPYQVAIGSPVTAFFQAEATLVQPLGPGLDMTLSLGYRHFSNGNLSPPNVGLNTTPMTLGIQAWRPARRIGARSGPDAAAAHTAPGSGARPGPSAWIYHLLPFAGLRGFAADNRHAQRDAVYVRQVLPVAGVHARATRPLNDVLAWAVLVGLTWDAGGFRAQEVPSLEAAPLDAAAAFALSGGISLMVDTGPALLEAGLGYAAVDLGAQRQVPRFYQRLGAHLQVSRRIEPFVVVRASSLDRPEFLEWGAAIRLH